MSRLQRPAIVAFCIHLLAGAAMAAILRHGLETNPDLQSRLGFLVDHRVLWTLGWLTWTAAAIAILYFYIAFAAGHSEDTSSTPALRLAVLLTAAAIAPDLSAQAIEIGVLPDLAGLNDPDRFVLFHRTAVLMSGYVANGLYSLSALILAWSTRNAYRPWIWLAGLAVGCFGFLLSAAALMNSPAGMFWSNVVLVPAILVWLGGVALRKKAL